MISGYLDSLSKELRLPRRERERILAETRDHLEEAVAAGQSEDEAVKAFGHPRELAARFHEQLASSSARRASAHTVVLMCAFVVAMALAAFAPGNAFPFGIPVFVGAQLAAVAGGIAFVRWVRYRSYALVPATRLADMYRTSAVAAGAVAVVALSEVANGAGAARPPLVIGGGVLFAAALVVGVQVRSAAARAHAIPATQDGAGEDVLHDVEAVAARYAPGLVSLGQRLPIPSRLDLRRHPWTFCLVFAAACGVGLAAWHGVVEAGGPLTFANAARSLFAGFVIASIEALAVIGCFAAFGRFLGVRR